MQHIIPMDLNCMSVYYETNLCQIRFLIWEREIISNMQINKVPSLVINIKISKKIDSIYYISHT